MFYIYICSYCIDSRLLASACILIKCIYFIKEKLYNCLIIVFVYQYTAT